MRHIALLQRLEIVQFSRDTTVASKLSPEKCLPKTLYLADVLSVFWTKPSGVKCLGTGISEALLEHSVW